MALAPRRSPAKHPLNYLYKLQTILNKAKDLGLLRLPIPLQCSKDFPILQYADDTLIIMEDCCRKLFILKALLSSFSASTGLKVNYQKSMMSKYISGQAHSFGKDFWVLNWQPPFHISWPSFGSNKTKN